MNAKFILSLVLFSIIGLGSYAQTLENRVYGEMNVNASFLLGMSTMEGQQVAGADCRMSALSLGFGLGYMIADGFSVIASSSLSVGHDAFDKEHSAMGAIKCHIGLDYNLGINHGIPFGVNVGLGWVSLSYSSSVAGNIFNVNNAYVPIGLTWWVTSRLGVSAQYEFPIIRGKPSEYTGYDGLTNFATQEFTIGLKARF